MDDRTKRYAHQALSYHTRILEGLSEAANCHDGEPQDGDLTVARGLHRVLEAARSMLTEQMGTTPPDGSGRHPIPEFLMLAARAWALADRGLQGCYSPSGFRSAISGMVERGSPTTPTKKLAFSSAIHLRRRVRISLSPRY